MKNLMSIVRFDHRKIGSKISYFEGSVEGHCLVFFVRLRIKRNDGG